MSPSSPASNNRFTLLRFGLFCEFICKAALPCPQNHVFLQSSFLYFPVVIYQSWLLNFFQTLFCNDPLDWGLGVQCTHAQSGWNFVVPDPLDCCQFGVSVLITSTTNRNFSDENWEVHSCCRYMWKDIPVLFSVIWSFVTLNTLSRAFKENAKSVTNINASWMDD